MKSLGTEYHRVFDIQCGVLRAWLKYKPADYARYTLNRSELVKVIKQELMRLRIIRELSH